MTSTCLRVAVSLIVPLLSAASMGPADSPSRARMQGISTAAFPNCGTLGLGVEPTNVGVVRIVLPAKIDLAGKIDRKVKFDNKPFPPSSGDDGLNDEGGKDNVAQTKATSDKRPFHIFIRKALWGSSEHILVRVIVRADRPYRLYDERGSDKPADQQLHGVGVDAKPGSGSLCGNIPIRHFGKKEVASFYIDLPKFQGAYEEGFNILLTPNDTEDTPVIIDPKVRNEG